jgi:hypothetical protein
MCAGVGFDVNYEAAGIHEYWLIDPERELGLI